MRPESNPRVALKQLPSDWDLGPRKTEKHLSVTLTSSYKNSNIIANIECNTYRNLATNPQCIVLRRRVWKVNISSSIQAKIAACLFLSWNDKSARKTVGLILRGLTSIYLFTTKSERQTNAFTLQRVLCSAERLSCPKTPHWKNMPRFGQTFPRDVMRERL